MPAVAFNKFNKFMENVFKGVHGDMSAGTYKVLLTNTLPVAANGVKADITQIAAGGGYVADGFTVVLSALTQTAGVVKAVFTDATLTATSGGIAAFRYAVLYQVVGSGPLIGWHDKGTAITLAEDDEFVWDADGSNGVFQAS